MKKETHETTMIKLKDLKAGDILIGKDETEYTFRSFGGVAPNWIDYMFSRASSGKSVQRRLERVTICFGDEENPIKRRVFVDTLFERKL